MGHNEVIGVCRVGNDADNLGRKHWNEMLTYPRKPVAHWHPLVEVSRVVGPSVCERRTLHHPSAALQLVHLRLAADCRIKKNGSDYHSSAIKACWLH